MIAQRKKAILLACLPVILAASVLGVLVSRSRALRQVVDPSTKIEVVSTIYPWADIAQNIGGELVQVTTLTSPGKEPHDYEPTPQDLVKLYQADVVILNGNGVDAWAEKLVDELRKKGVRTIRMSDQLEALTDDSGVDPHFWLDPVLAREAVDYISVPITMTLVGQNAVQATERAKLYQTRLDALDTEYRIGLAQCERREIVTSHNAFRYLAKRYKLTNYYILGLSPEEDPSPQKIAEVADLARQKGTTTIFFETLVSPKLAQTIANEIGVKTATLNPIEGLTEKELASGKDYIGTMQENLRHLRSALNCL